MSSCDTKYAGALLVDNKRFAEISANREPYLFIKDISGFSFIALCEGTVTIQAAGILGDVNINSVTNALKSLKIDVERSTGKGWAVECCWIEPHKVLYDVRISLINPLFSFYSFILFPTGAEEVRISQEVQHELHKALQRQEVASECPARQLQGRRSHDRQLPA